MSENHAQTITKLAIEAQGNVSTFKQGDRLFVAHPPGWQVHEKTQPHEQPIPQPRYVKETVELQTVGSLVSYVIQYKNPGRTAIFADLDERVIHAAMDYHATQAVNDAGLRAHNATLSLRPSDEWNFWMQNNNHMMTQEKFAQLLTENAEDVILPEGFSNLQEIVLDLEGEKVLRVARRMRRAHSSAGKSSVQVEQNISDLPPEMTLRIPVFMNEDKVSVRTFLRDDVQPTGVLLGYRMVRTEQLVQNELQRICSVVAELTQVPMFIGTVDQK